MKRKRPPRPKQSKKPSKPARRPRQKSKDAPTNLRPYIFHGVQVQTDEKQSQAECPWCGDPDLMGIKTETGQWRCVKCEENGNVYTFLTKLHEQALEHTTTKALTELSKLRGVSLAALKAWGVAQHPLLPDDWLVPMYNQKGKLANLSRWTETRDGWKLMSTPNMVMHPYGTNLIKKTHKRIKVVEGPWDGMAMWDGLQRTQQRLFKGDRPSEFLPCKPTDPKAMHTHTAVMAVPGCGSFNPDWLHWLDGRDTADLVYDNDHPRTRHSGETWCPAWDGMELVCKTMGVHGRRPKHTRMIHWGTARKKHSSKIPNGHDVRDQLAASGTPHVMMEYLEKKLKRVNLAKYGDAELGDGNKIQPADRTSFTQLCKDWDKALHFTPQLRDTLATMLACMISTTLQGEQLWLRVIGPPGSGKSTLAEAVSCAKEYVFAKSMFTGFHSGFTGGNDKGKVQKDASLIPHIKGKTFMVKDGDTLLTAPSRDRILAELRDIYDGTSRAAYRNKKSVDYEDIRTTMILCGTDTLRTLNRSALGERFLDCEILGDNDTQPYLERAAANTAAAVLSGLGGKADEETDSEATPDSMTELKAATYGYLKHLKENLQELPVPTISPAINSRLMALGQLMAFMRASKDEEADFRQRPELATRLVAQMVKLGVCLSLVLGKKSVDNTVLAMCRKIILDTARGYKLDIVQELASHKAGLSVKQINIEMSIPETTARRLIEEMREFDVVERNSQSNRSGQRGRNVHLFRLTADFRKLWTLATSVRKGS